MVFERECVSFLEFQQTTLGEAITLLIPHRDLSSKMLLLHDDKRSPFHYNLPHWLSPVGESI